MLGRLLFILTSMIRSALWMFSFRTRLCALYYVYIAVARVNQELGSVSP